MRLIDADILIEKLKSYAECDWNKSLCAMLPSVVDDCIEFVDEQPTAYGIDKIVEELEKREEHYVEMLDWQGQSAICDAIEIVKQGGMTDDVCEPSADKIKVTSLDVIVTGSKRKPYYEIKYKEVGTDNYNIGYSSYNLDFVLDWKEKCFELVKVVE